MLARRGPIVVCLVTASITTALVVTFVSPAAGQDAGATADARRDVGA